jgi:hypothetical protein
VNAFKSTILSSAIALITSQVTLATFYDLVHQILTLALQLPITGQQLEEFYNKIK